MCYRAQPKTGRQIDAEVLARASKPVFRKYRKSNGSKYTKEDRAQWAKRVGVVASSWPF